MSQEPWPSPDRPARPALPRLDDLPVAEEGYDRKKVREAFDAFYRHAAELDAALRTLEAVDAFQRSAAELRTDLRAIRSAGWAPRGWQTSLGGGLRGERSTLPEWFPRVAGEVVFLIAVAVTLGLTQPGTLVILLSMGLALLIVWAVEWLASRERAAPPAGRPVPRVLEAEVEPAALPPEQASLAPASSGWDAYAEAAPEDRADALTIIEAPAGEEEARVEAEALEPEPEPGAVAEVEREREAEPEGEAVAEPVAEVSGFQPLTQPEPEPGAVAEVEREREAEPEGEAVAEPVAEVSGFQPLTQPEPEPAEPSTVEPERIPEPEPVAEAEPEREAELEPVVEAEPVAEVSGLQPLTQPGPEPAEPSTMEPEPIPQPEPKPTRRRSIFSRFRRGKEAPPEEPVFEHPTFGTVRVLAHDDEESREEERFALAEPPAAEQTDLDPWEREFDISVAEAEIEETEAEAVPAEEPEQPVGEVEEASQKEQLPVELLADQAAEAMGRSQERRRPPRRARRR